ncbi:MAG: polysaccharide deacetylase family protein [Spirochaetales bacterium]|nr:polysaccharide deacetylase family protein [Spirochaetales bacterium]
MKRKLNFLFLSCVLLVSGFVLNADMLGDVNLDNAVNIVDALLIAQDYVNLQPANFHPEFADVDCSGEHNIVDSLLIAKFFVNAISEFPCSLTPVPTETPTVTPTATPDITPTPDSGSCNGSAGNVYLTFDDGPTGNTQTIVNSLLNAGACKATFFVIGQNMPGNSAAYKQAGFSVQNHSFTHPHLGSYSYQQVQSELQRCNDAIINAGFPKPVAIRLPYLESSNTVQQVCSSLGLQIIQPSVDTQDWNGRSTQQIIQTASAINAGQNPLMHENQAATIGAITSIVQNLKNRNLGFTQY